MTELKTDISVDGPAEAFAALKELRTEYSQLLRRLRDDGDVLTFLPELETFIRRGRATGARLHVPQDRWDAQRSLDYWSTMLYRAGLEPPDATLEEFDPEQAPQLSDDLCPYLGLDAFQEQDEGNYFGRRELIEKLVARLREGNFLVVIGPSGSGKSSIVKAGILPQLKRGAISGSENWHYFPRSMVPGSEPLTNIARLVAATASSEQLSTHVKSLREGADHLLRLLNDLGKPSVLVVDQFEELFTLCDDEAARRAFTDNLLHVIESPGVGHRVILTMRIDYEPFVARLAALYPRFSEAEERITPFSTAELRDAIEKPAERIGLVFEDGVVDSLLQDILGEPAALPLLQFTLLKLWENRVYNRITLEAYHRLGGGRLALARSADALYEEMSPEHQNTTQRIFLRMVRPGSGLEVTSSRVLVASLFVASEAPDRVEAVLKRLIEARLVRLTEGETPADAQVEVAHEALVRNWPRLVGWLEDERGAMAIRRRLELKALEWKRLGMGTSGLLDDTQLYEAERWLGSPDATRLGYDESLTALVDASRASLTREKHEKEKAREREREQLQALALAQAQRAEEQELRATESHKKAVMLRWLSIALAVMFVIALGAFYWANRLREMANEQTRVAKIEKEEADKQRQLAESRLELARDARKETDETVKRFQDPQSLVINVIKTADALKLRSFGRPLRPGQSISGLSSTGGTLGCIVQDSSGQKYVLTSSTLVDEVGEGVVQPGVIDGGQEKEKVAVVSRIDKNTLTAIARILPGIEFSNEIPGFRTITEVGPEVKIGDEVTLIGRTSGVVTGRVTGLQVTISLAEGFMLKDAVEVTRYSSGGDGGAAVLDREGRLVGIHVAGSNRVSIFVPIAAVLKALDVQLDRPISPSAW
jgi:energy-coupling factor transporter ATP-binding protein EcfA2